jgi:hypothetical protein
MLTSVVVRAAELLAVVLAAGTITLAAGLWWLRRRVRRLRRAGQMMAVRAAMAAVGAANRGRRRAWSVPLPDRRWLAAARERRRLWRAVAAAEHAVAVARQAGAPTGDLDGLCRRLRQAAGDADRCLSVSRRPAEPGAGHGAGAMAEVSDLVAAAGVIQDAAASAVASMARPASASLAEDVRREAAALAAGIAAAAGAGHQGEPG